jgi:hypothetical protein
VPSPHPALVQVLEILDHGESGAYGEAEYRRVDQELSDAHGSGTDDRTLNTSSVIGPT